MNGLFMFWLGNERVFVMILNDYNQNYMNNSNVADAITMFDLDLLGKTFQKSKEDEPIKDRLDLIYAEDGDSSFDADMDYNQDSKISYIEYLRYCEENAKTEEKHSDTKIVENDKFKFMTTSFGKASGAYQRNYETFPEGKIVSQI